MWFVKKQNQKEESQNNSGIEVVHKNGELFGSLRIPEPTRSLVWITDEETSKIEQAGSINMEININLSNGDVDVKEKENGFYAEPSLIWSKLPVTPSERREKEAMYWPSYSRLDPESRYEYLRWLGDITQPTNLSYVFLYFYGLERHLLIGNYDAAVDEIIRLIEYHDKKSFRQYAAASLTIASLARNRLDIIERAPFLLEEEIDETLSLRIYKGTTMTPEDIIDIASKVGFINKRYIKLHPELFKSELQKLIVDFEARRGNILSVFKLDDFKQVETSVFANSSIPEKIRLVKVPVILGDRRFQTCIKALLDRTHANVKLKLATNK